MKCVQGEMRLGRSARCWHRCGVAEFEWGLRVQFGAQTLEAM
jgi:hypothetical protein